MKVSIHILFTSIHIAVGLLYSQTTESFRNAKTSNLATREIHYQLRSMANDSAKDKALSYYVHFQYGVVKFYDNSFSSSITSISVQPLPGKTGLGLDFFLVDDLGFNRDKFFSLIPALNLQNDRFCFKLGLNFIKIIESEDAPEMLVVPALAVRLGVLRRFYFSMEVFSDMYVYPGSFRMTYVFDDHFSNFMMGFFWGGETEYSGYTGKVEVLFYKQVFLSTQINVRDFDKDTSLRLGLGYVL